jgi:hypothetical protein
LYFASRRKKGRGKKNGRKSHPIFFSISEHSILANQPSAPENLRPRREVVYPELNFTVSHLFCLGSPLAAVLAMRGDPMQLDDPPRAGSARIFNLFHPYDPMVRSFFWVFFFLFVRLR